MKHSNWILGIGILVAAILLTGSLLFKSEPVTDSGAPSATQPMSTVSKTAKKLVLIPLKEVSMRLFHIE